MSTHGERERERESNLSSVSSLKKSFTLIELSIVLLILSLLVGSLLVGRQIVDRAKIQRIIFEFDYYEKAFHQFYDTYRVVPGALTQKECVKYAEFRRPNLTIVGNNGSSDFCGCMALTQKYNSKLISPTTAELIVLKDQFAASGLINITLEQDLEFKNLKNWGYTSNIVQCSAKYGDIDSVLSDSKPHPYSFQTSFSERALIQFNALNWQFIQSHNLWAKFRKYAFNGSNTYLNESYPIEWDNAQFKNVVENHNLMAVVDAPTVFYNGKTRYANDTKKYGAFGAKIASQIDAKIDDGRPGSGRVLAMKSAMAHVSATTDNMYMENCYDKSALEVDKAIYHTHTDLKYGCNLVKVMEDVK